MEFGQKDQKVMQKKKIVSFIVALIVSLQIFSQDTSSVQVILIDDNELLIMTPERGREIASDLIEGDSCCDRSVYLEGKVNSLLLIVESDSLSIKNLTKDKVLCQRQQDRYAMKDSYQKTRIRMLKDDIKYYKRRGIKALLIGLATGTIFGIIVK